MRQRIATAAMIAVVGLLTFPRAASTCSCAHPRPMCNAYRNADAVFDATVVRITLSSRTETIAGRERRIEEKLVSVNVHQSWKGAEPGPLEIATARDDAACGYDFKKGRRYLVFAYRRTDGHLTVSICGSTREARSPKFDPSRCTDPSASSSESFACSLERRVPTLARG